MPEYHAIMKLVPASNLFKVGDTVRVDWIIEGSSSGAGYSVAAAIVGWDQTILRMQGIDNSGVSSYFDAPQAPKGSFIPAAGPIVTINKGEFVPGQFNDGLPNNERGLCFLMQFASYTKDRANLKTPLKLTSLIFNAIGEGTTEVSFKRAGEPGVDGVKFGNDENTYVYDSRSPGLKLRAPQWHQPATVVVEAPEEFDPNTLSDGGQYTTTVDDFLPLIDSYSSSLGSFNPPAFIELRSSAELLVDAVKSNLHGVVVIDPESTDPFESMVIVKPRPEVEPEPPETASPAGGSGSPFSTGVTSGADVLVRPGPRPLTRDEARKMFEAEEAAGERPFWKGPGVWLSWSNLTGPQQEVLITMRINGKA